MFDNRVLPVSEDIMFKWRLLVETGRKVGHTFPQPDLIISATALHHGLTVVTRNVRDFAALEVPVLSPFAVMRKLACRSSTRGRTKNDSAALRAMTLELRRPQRWAGPTDQK